MTQPPTMHDDVAAIVAKMTQRQWDILGELTYFPDANKGGARPMDVQAHYGRKSAPILRQLCDKGLARFTNWAHGGHGARGSCRYWITPLGFEALAFRSALIARGVGE